LEKHFSISLSSSSDDEGWQIVLVPLPGPFEKVIASIVVEGDLFVESLVVVSGVVAALFGACVCGLPGAFSGIFFRC